MKELSLREAKIALAEGHIVSTEDGHHKWQWTKDGLQYSLYNGFWEGGARGPSSDLDHYTIYKPQPKSLSFEEALKAFASGEKLFIDFGRDLLSVEGLGTTGRHINATDKEDWDKQLFYLHMASQHGWLISKEGE